MDTPIKALTKRKRHDSLEKEICKDIIVWRRGEADQEEAVNDAMCQRAFAT